MTRILLGSLLAVLCFAQGGAPKKGHATGHRSHVMIAPDAVRWGPPEQSWIQGTPPSEFGPLQSQFAVIAGDPSKPGALFTIRIKSPDGAKIAPHWHPQDEHITVLQGTLMLAVGEKYDERAGKPLTTGSYAVMPRRVWHFAKSQGESIVQVHGMGPFIVNFEKMSTEAGKKATSSN